MLYDPKTMLVTDIIKQYISQTHPQYQQVSTLLWQYLFISAAESVSEATQSNITKAAIKTAHEAKLTDQQILEACYPDFYLNIESHIKKFFNEYV